MRKVLTLIILAGFSVVNAQSDPIITVASQVEAKDPSSTYVGENAFVPSPFKYTININADNNVVGEISPFKYTENENGKLIGNVIHAIEIQEEGTAIEEGGQLNLPVLFAPEVQNEGGTIDDNKLIGNVIHAIEIQEEGTAIEEGGQLNLPVLFAPEVQEVGTAIEEGGQLDLPVLHAPEVQDEGSTEVEEGGQLTLPALAQTISKDDFTVAPTVSTDLIQITSKIEGYVKIVVISMTGEVKLIDRFMDRYDIDITDYAKGIYVVHVTKGKSITTTKFLKQ